MKEEPRITLAQIINIIGDEVGMRYCWHLIGIDAQGVLGDHLTLEDICEKIESVNLGYYEVTWDFIKEISKKLGAVVDFHLIGSKDRESFLKERNNLNLTTRNWIGIKCELEFLIEDGEIWEINGENEILVKRLKKTFSQLPILLM